MSNCFECIKKKDLAKEEVTASHLSHLDYNYWSQRPQTIARLRELCLLPTLRMFKPNATTNVQVTSS